MIRTVHIALICLFLFVHSGLLKWLHWPVDPTLIFLLASFGFALGYVRRTALDRNTVVLFVLYALLLGWMALTSIYTISSGYWMEKLARVGMNSLAFFLPVLFIRDERDWYALRKISLFFVFLGMLILFFGYSKNQLVDLLFYDSLEDFLKLRYPDYITLSLFVASGIFLVPHDRPFLMILVSVAAIILMIILGARGPILFLIPAIVYFQLRARNVVNLIVVFVMVIVPVSIIVGTTHVEDRMTGRFTIMVNEQEGDDRSSGERVKYLERTIDIVKKYPLLGTGVGGYGVAADGIDGRSSPHNIFLEIQSELGVIGSVIFLIFAAMFVSLLFRKTSMPAVHVAGAICVLLLLELLISSILEDLRITLFWMGVFIALRQIDQRKNYVRDLRHH